MLYDTRWDAKTKESELVEALKCARAMIEDRWCPKGGTDDKGGVCAIVAMGAAAGAWSTLYAECRQTLRAAIPLQLTESVPEWHDAVGRTQGEVIAAFDRAIALARAHD
jgi:hypothetical protein